MSKHAEIAIRHRSLMGTTMAYREAGDADAPVALFLHGNPTSSYVWRNILPLVAPVAHCIAPDLIGFGGSGKPDIAYRFFDHVRYLDALIDELQISSAYLVAQDWGTALAFHLAARRPDFVRGLAFMEFIRPMPSWGDFHQHDSDDSARQTFRKFRTPGEGEAMILEGNAFIERVLPGGMLRKLSAEEMAAYRTPFPTPESRRPILALPRQLPIEGEPADVDETLRSAHAALAASAYPKLLHARWPWRRPALSAGGSSRGDRAIGRRLDRRRRGSHLRAIKTSRLIAPAIAGDRSGQGLSARLSARYLIARLKISAGNGEAGAPTSLKLHCRMRRMAPRGFASAAMNPVKWRIPPPRTDQICLPNMLKERVFIHNVRIPLRLKTRYHRGPAAGGKVRPSAVVRAIAFEV